MTQSRERLVEAGQRASLRDHPRRMLSGDADRADAQPTRRVGGGGARDSHGCRQAASRFRNSRLAARAGLCSRAHEAPATTSREDRGLGRLSRANPREGVARRLGVRSEMDCFLAVARAAEVANGHPRGSDRPMRPGGRSRMAEWVGLRSGGSAGGSSGFLEPRDRHKAQRHKGLYPDRGHWRAAKAGAETAPAT